jgi:uncharacterized YigZ family protein
MASRDPKSPGFLFLCMSDTLLTIAAPAQGAYKEKGSRFLAFAYPVANEAAAKTCLAILRKEYYDATHHCYAYILGRDQKNFRANDDGEPSGTAGLPILNLLRSRQLTQVLLVVVRYYGGTNLGASGLAKAYKAAAADALDHSQVVERVIYLPLTIRFGYLAMNEVMRVVKEYQLTIAHQHHDNTCTLTVHVREGLWAEVRAKLGPHGTLAEPSGAQDGADGRVSG